MVAACRNEDGLAGLGPTEPDLSANRIAVITREQSGRGRIASSIDTPLTTAGIARLGAETTMAGYPFEEIEAKWQTYWSARGTFRVSADPDTTRPKYYVLDMFPYPSGEGLHVGHPEPFSSAGCSRHRYS